MTTRVVAWPIPPNTPLELVKRITVHRQHTEGLTAQIRKTRHGLWFRGLILFFSILGIPTSLFLFSFGTSWLELGWTVFFALLVWYHRSEFRKEQQILQDLEKDRSKSITQIYDAELEASRLATATETP